MNEKLHEVSGAHVEWNREKDFCFCRRQFQGQRTTLKIKTQNVYKQVN